jgi:serine/threonine protein kinase
MIVLTRRMEVFGRYHLQEQIGRGGMGVVYRAFDTVLERVVALKLVQTPTQLEPELRERFFREARAAAHLSHQNIVTIYDLGEHDGRPYIAMEYLDGEDLQQRLARPERMSLRRKLDLAVEICHGIEYAHSRGIVHRDLKPANVYIAESGTAKILDFGLARLMTSQLTQSNMLMGTLNYMAPEQVRGERADQRSDIFSMGVVLYELFGGRRAFEGDSVASTLYKILEVTPEPLLQIDRTLSPALAAIVDRAMAKLRDERYSDMTALRVDLDTFRQQHLAAGPTTPMTMPSDWDHATSPRLTVDPSGMAAPIPARANSMSRTGIGVTVATLAVIAAAVLWMFSRKESPPPPQQTVNAAQPSPNPVTAQLSAAQAAPDKRQNAAAVSAADPARARMAEGRSAAEGSGAAPRAATAARTAAAAPVVPPRPQPAPSTPADAPPAAPPAAATPAVAAPPPIPSTQPVDPSAVGAHQPSATLPVPPSAIVNSPPADETAQPAAAEDRIIDLIGRYKDALESRNIDRVKRLWPSLGGAAETALRQEFEHSRQIAVGITDRQISVAGNAGSVSFVRSYSILTVEGQRLQSTSRAMMEVRRAGNNWVIDAIRFSPK